MLSHVKNLSGVKVQYVTENDYLEAKKQGKNASRDFCQKLL